MCSLCHRHKDHEKLHFSPCSTNISNFNWVQIFIQFFSLQQIFFFLCVYERAEGIIISIIHEIFIWIWCLFLCKKSNVCFTIWRFIICCWLLVYLSSVKIKKNPAQVDFFEKSWFHPKIPQKGPLAEKSLM